MGEAFDCFSEYVELSHIVEYCNCEDVLHTHAWSAENDPWLCPDLLYYRCYVDRFDRYLEAGEVVEAEAARIEEDCCTSYDAVFLEPVESLNDGVDADIALLGDINEVCPCISLEVPDDLDVGIVELQPGTDKETRRGYLKP